MFPKRFKQAACLMLAVWLMGSATGCTVFRNPLSGFRNPLTGLSNPFAGGETTQSRVKTGWESNQRIPIRSSFGRD